MAELTRVPRWTRKLLTGLAEHCAAAGIGVWKPDGYDGADWAITHLAMPDKPDHALCITPYLPTNRLDTALASLRVQFRTRAPAGDPLRALDDQDDLFDFWHRHAAADFDGVRVSRFARVSLLELGKDAAGRMEFTSNFELTGLRWLQNPAAEAATPLP